MAPLRAWISLFVALSLLACGDAPDAPVERGVIRRDSAGISIIEFAGRLDVQEAPRLKARRVLQIGGEGSDIELFRVSGARFLADGSLAIGNGGTAEILQVDPTGELLRVLGRRGEGPGEFATITSLHAGASDSLIVFDDRQGRLSVWGSSESVLGTRRMSDPSSTSDILTLSGGFDDTMLAIVSMDRRFPGEGMRRDTTPLLRYTPGRTSPDTLALWPTRLAEYERREGGGWGVSFVGLGPDLLRAGNRTHVALADTHRPEVVVYSQHGQDLVIRWRDTPRAVRDEERVEWLDAIRASRLEAPADIRERLAALPLPPVHDTYPLLLDLALSAGGEIWLAVSSDADVADQEWVRLGPDGERRGWVALPREVEVLDVAGGRVAILRRTELDIELVEVYEIVEASNSG